MTDRENFLSIAHRTGYERMPVYFTMCPSLAKKFNDYIKENPIEINTEFESTGSLHTTDTPSEVFYEKYYKGQTFKEGSHIDGYGIAHEPGSDAAFHMTYMRHPMENFDSAEQILEYPLPVIDWSNFEKLKEQADKIHKKNKAVMSWVFCSPWETSWYMRGMENLMCDMMSDSDIATALLDRMTNQTATFAKALAMAGADAIFLGDDIGMQHSIMMSESLYDEWLKPRLKKIIDTIRGVNPDVVVFYHSCGHVTELIPYLIEAGIDVLDPVQPECMDFREIHDKFGDQISFHGTIGTQTVMPFGTPDEVRRKVFENLDIAGEKGGLFVCPTHLLEPEVPVENIIAYIKACEDYTK